MNARQLAQFVSFVTTEQTLKTTTETGEIAGLPALLTQISANIGEINQTANTQNQLTQGKTARRNEQLDLMREQALEVVNAVRAHAIEHNLTEVLPLTNVGAPDFARLRIAERPLLALRVHDTAIATLPELPGLRAFKAAIENVRVALAQPRSLIAERRAATDRLRNLLADTERLLTRVDCLLFPLRKTNPEFYLKYLATREPVNARRTAASGNAAPAAAAPASVASASVAPTPASAATEKRAA